MRKKYLFSDIDGTLIQNRRVDRDTLNKLNHFISKGNELVLASGRQDRQIKHLLEQLELETPYRISQNGSIITDKDDNIILETKIESKIAIEIAEYIFTIPDVLIEVSDIHNRYSEEQRSEVFEPDLTEGHIITDKLLSKVQSQEIKPVVLIVLSENEKHLKQIKKHLLEHYSEDVNVIFTSLTSLEIVDKKATKGNAIEYLAEKLKIQRTNIYVVGDSENDISMFDKFSNSFAIKHAKPSVYRSAKYGAFFVGDVVDFINGIYLNLSKKSVVNIRSSLVPKIMLNDNTYNADDLVRRVDEFIDAGMRSVFVNKNSAIGVAKKAYPWLPLFLIPENNDEDSKKSFSFKIGNKEYNKKHKAIQASLNTFSDFVCVDACLNHKNYENLEYIINLCKSVNEDVVSVAIVSNNSEAAHAQSLGFDMILVTFENKVDFSLISKMKRVINIPIIVNCNFILSLEDAVKLINYGVFSIAVINNDIESFKKFNYNFMEQILDYTHTGVVVKK